jgi:F-type H+-transporting ATPase subunit c
MLYLFGLVIATGFAVAVAGFAGGLGQGKAIAAAMEGMARQPENSGRIQTAMIIGLAFIESLTIYALVMGFILMGKLPNTADVLKAIMGGH